MAGGVSSRTGNPSNLILRLILPLYLPTFLFSLSQGILLPTLPLFAHSFGVSFTLVTVAIGIQGVGTLAASVPAGFVIARAGGRPVMIAGSGIVALSSLALPFAGLFPLLVAYRFVGGVGAALWTISRFAFIAASVPVDQRGRVSALFGGVSRAGMFAGPIVGGVLAQGPGMRVALLASALAAFGALAVAAVFIKRESAARPLMGGGLILGALVKAVRESPAELTSASTAQLFIQLLRGGRTTLLPLFGSFAIGLDVDTLGIIIGASALIDMVLFYPAGFIMDRFGRKFASVPAFVILTAGMVLVSVAVDATSLFIAAAVMSLGNGLGSGSMMTLGADLAPPEARGEFLGFWRLIGDSGSTGGPLLVGGMADLWGFEAAAIAVAGFGLAAVITLAFFVPETLRYETRAQRGPEP